MSHRSTRLTLRRKPSRRHSALVLLTVAIVGLLTLISPVSGAPPGPSTPTKLAVTGATSTSITLGWTASESRNKDIVAYDLYQDAVVVGSLTQTEIAQLPKLKYAFEGLTCGTSYTLGVAARDSIDHLSEIASVVASTSPCVDTQPPTAPSGISQIAKTSTSATVTWVPSKDNVGVAGYGAYQSGLRIDQTALTSYTFSSLPCGTSTAIGLDAYDTAGNRSSQTSFVVSTSSCSDTQPPTAPTGLKQTGATSTSISLKWSASTDNIGVAYYAVRVNGSQAGTTGQTNYTVTRLTCSTSYSIVIAAYDAVGNHAFSTAVTFSTAACAPSSGTDSTPPTVPSNEKVASVTAASITLSWSPSTDNVGVAGYDAYNGGTRVAQPSQTSYTFTGLNCGQSYTLAIDAYDAAGNRSDPTYATEIASTSACSVGPAPTPDNQPPTVPTNVAVLNRTGTSISITWSPSTDNVGVVGYGVYEDGTAAGTTSTAGYTVTGLLCGTSYTIGVDAYDSAGNRSAPTAIGLSTAACGDTQPPTAPGSLLASGVAQTAATLSWTASSDNVGVAGYDLYANGIRVGTTTSTTYAFTGLTCDAPNMLGVEAFDAAGNRSVRPSINAVTAACSTSTTSLYVSPTGSDANACLQGSPCASFDRAYQLAQPGQTVQIAGGSYGKQVILPRSDLRGMNGCDPYGEWGSATTDKCVTFTPAAGATVTMTGPLEVHGSSLYFKGTRSGGIEVDRSGYNWRVRGWVDVETDVGGSLQDHVVFNGIYSKTILSSDSDKTMFRQMSVGGQIASAQSGSCMWIDTDDGQPVASMESKFLMRNVAVPTNVVLDQDYFHDTDRDNAGADASCHFGGMIIVNVNGMTIRRSVFVRQWVYPIEIKKDTGSQYPTNITIENNWFGCAVGSSATNDADGGRSTCTGQDAVQIDGAGSSPSNYVIRYNSFSQSGSVGCYDANCSWSNFRIVGNAGQVPSGGSSGPCGSSGATFSDNVWVGGTCGGGDQSVSSFGSLFQSNAVGSENFHLVAGSPAINAGDSTNYPGLDQDGTARPLGGKPDAGADEVG